MKHLMLILLLLMLNAGNAQSIGFIPEQGASVSDADYRLAVRIFSETYDAVKKNKGAFNYANYWNLAFAYTLTEQPNSKIVELIRCSQEANPSDFAEVFLAARDLVNRWDRILPTAAFADIKKAVSNPVPSAPAAAVMPDKRGENFDPKLHDLFKVLDEDDGRYRQQGKTNLSLQRLLDHRNLKIIDSLYQEYGTYLGKDLVGAELDYVMWMVIQHSNVMAMKKYLPVIRQAIKDKQLRGTSPLKLLIDRIHTADHGTQIFGSQQGVPLADDATINRVATENGLEVSNHSWLKKE